VGEKVMELQQSGVDTVFIRCLLPTVIRSLVVANCNL